jgi:hypothetical protein
MFTGNPPRPTTHILRQLVIRWDVSGKVGEIQARYEDGANTNGDWVQGMLNAFRKQGGAPAEQSRSSDNVWSDVQPGKPAPVTYTWHDDITRLMLRRDAGGAEVIVRDCPPEHPAGVPLPPLATLPRGPNGVRLGETREELLNRWNGESSLRPDGSVELVPTKAGPYDGVLVWFDKDRAVRIVARHAPEGASPLRPADAARSLLQTWGKEGPTLGWPTHRDNGPDNLLQNVGWDDDPTRILIFRQDANDGTARLFTEWKELVGIE